MMHASFFWALRIDLYSLACSRVPTPWLEKTSASSDSSVRPSMTWMRDQCIGISAAQIVGGQALKDLMRDAIGGVEGQLQSDRIRDAGADQIGRRLAGLRGELADLVRRTMNQDDADAERTQQSDIEQ